MKKGDDVSSSRPGDPGAFSSSNTRSERLRVNMEGGYNDRKRDCGTSSDCPRANNENKGDGVSSEIPGAFSSSATRSKRLRAKTEGGFDYRKIDGGTSSEQPKTNNEKKGDGVSSSIPSAFSSYTTRSKRLREKMEGGSNDIKRDGGTSSEKPKTNNEKKAMVYLYQDLATSHHLLLEANF